MYFSGSVIISDLNKEKLLQFIGVLTLKEFNYSIKKIAFGNEISFKKEINQDNYFDFFELIKTHKELVSEAKSTFINKLME